MIKPHFLLLATASLLVSATANASLENQISQCAAIQDKLERLVCFDNLASSIGPQKTSKPQTSKLTVPAASATVTATKIDPSEDFGRVYKTEETIEKVQLQVKSVTKDPRGILKISFTNGQVWKQTDTTRFKLKDDQIVYIEKAALGSFILGTDGRNSTIRVKRLK